MNYFSYVVDSNTNSDKLFINVYIQISTLPENNFTCLPYKLHMNQKAVRSI